MNKESWKIILKVIVAVATALLGVFGANAAMGIF
ncbi:smalltalk protein [Prevotella sp. OH937_COT-195]|nr:smalltalk protein [Prevotella sp. OH937_COT-195]